MVIGSGLHERRHSGRLCLGMIGQPGGKLCEDFEKFGLWVGEVFIIDGDKMMQP